MAAGIGFALGGLGEDFAKGKMISQDRQAKNRQQALDQAFKLIQIKEALQRMQSQQEQEKQKKEQQGWDHSIRYKVGGKRYEMNPITLATREEPIPGEATVEGEPETPEQKGTDAANQLAAEAKRLKEAGFTQEQINQKLGLKEKAEGYELRQDSKGRYVYFPKDPTGKPIYTDVIGKVPKSAEEIAAGSESSVEENAKSIAAGDMKLSDVPVKQRSKVAQYMREHNLKPAQKLGVVEQRTKLLMAQLEPKVAALKDFIEKNKLTDQNDWIFGSHSALVNHLKFQGYKFGHEPDKISAQMIRLAAALKVMGAGPWAQLGRGRYMFETIAQHLPDPNDTPQQLYSKALFLQTIVDEAKQAIGEEEGGETTSDPMKLFTKPR